MKQNTTKRKSAKTNPMKEPGTGRTEKSSKEDELLTRLLKVKTPIVHESVPATQSGSSDIVGQIMRDHPGTTEDEIWEMIEGLGLMKRPKYK